MSGDNLFLALSNFRWDDGAHGKVQVWTRGAAGYRLSQELKPTACYGTDLDRCNFGLFMDAGQDYLTISSIGGVEGDVGAIGLVNIYRRSGTHWDLVDILRPIRSQLNQITGYGTAMDIDGRQIAIAAPSYSDVAGETRGMVFIYAMSDQGKAVLRSQIRAPAMGASGFGRAIRLRGDTLAVSEPHVGGRAHVYQRDASGAWSRLQTLFRPIGTNDLVRFGTALDMTPDQLTLAVSDPDIFGSEHQGRVFLYTRGSVDDPFVHVQTLTGTEQGVFPSMNDFGVSLSMESDLLVIGSRGQTVNGSRRGACEVYRREATGLWGFSERLTEPLHPIGAETFVGNSVKLADGRVLAGDERWSPTGTGLYVTGRAFLWNLQHAGEICPGVQSSIKTTVMRRDDGPASLDVVLDGLQDRSVLMLFAGLPQPLPGNPLQDLCLANPKRVTGPLYVEGGQGRILVNGVGLGALQGSVLAIQSVHFNPNAVPRVTFGPAMELFD